MPVKYYHGSKLLASSDDLLHRAAENELAAKHGISWADVRMVRVTVVKFSTTKLAPNTFKLKVKDDRGYLSYLVKRTKRGTCIWDQGWKQLTVGHHDWKTIVSLVRLT